MLSVKPALFQCVVLDRLGESHSSLVARLQVTSSTGLAIFFQQAPGRLLLSQQYTTYSVYNGCSNTLVRHIKIMCSDLGSGSRCCAFYSATGFIFTVSWKRFNGASNPDHRIYSCSCIGVFMISSVQYHKFQLLLLLGIWLLCSARDILTWN